MAEKERLPFEKSAKAVKDALRIGIRSVYELSSILGWTYGKTNFVTSRMLREGTIFAKEAMKGGRATKLVSTVPFDLEEEGSKGADVKSKEAMIELSGVCSKQNEIISEIISRKLVDRKMLMALVKELGIDLAEMAGKLDRFLPKEGEG